MDQPQLRLDAPAAADSLANFSASSHLMAQPQLPTVAETLAHTTAQVVFSNQICLVTIVELRDWP